MENVSPFIILFQQIPNPHSDAAEYRLWGNGVALPNVCFVLAGIVWAKNNEGAD